MEGRKPKSCDFLDEVSLAAHSYMLLAVIRARIGTPVPDDIRRRIHAEQAFTRMEHWAVDIHNVLFLRRTPLLAQQEARLHPHDELGR